MILPAMLRNTFCHVPGVSVQGEQRLWASGLVSWDAMASAGATLRAARRERLRQHLEESERQLAARKADYFADALPTTEQWRLYADFRDAVAYLDIETTGLGGPGDHITTVALYDGRTIRHYVHGQNLEQFGRDIRDYRLLVTYNGKCFDLPMIRSCLGLPMDQAHIDLRYVLKSLGYAGGLKSCERQLGLDRGDLADVDGWFAVILWREYKRRRDRKALETLLAYNIRDVVNLEQLLVKAFNLKVHQTPFATSLRLADPVLPEEPFRADTATIQRLKRQWGIGCGSGGW